MSSKIARWLLAPWVSLKINAFLSDETEYLYSEWFPERAANQELATRQWLSNKPNSELALDIGCADGWHTGVMADYYKKVVGFDKNPHMIRNAISRKSASNVSFFLGDHTVIFRYPPPDLVSICGVLTYVASEGKAIRMLRVSSATRWGIVAGKRHTPR